MPGLSLCAPCELYEPKRRVVNGNLALIGAERPASTDAPRALAVRAIIPDMPASKNERQALQRERDELPAHVANYQRELEATPERTRNGASG